MISKPATQRLKQRSFAGRVTAVLLVAMVAACTTALPAPFTPWTLSGPTSPNQCQKMPPEGQCPRCAHCAWNVGTHVCTVDNYAASSCQCYEGQTTTCPSGSQTCHITDKTHSTACL